MWRVFCIFHYQKCSSRKKSTSGKPALEHATVELFHWFSNNLMQANPDKCHLTTSKIEDIVVDVENNPIK